MSHLKPDDFARFFHELYGYPPFPWQERLTVKVCEDAWPQVIDLPTASGKTACLDIALFALAVTGCAPRRIFFVVDRRVIVDEAYQRMSRTARKLSEAKDGVLAAVAGSLRELAGVAYASPLTVYQLRGGVYRDPGWMRSPLQPMVVTSTVDQVGSRLLFRGYGVTDSSAPIHAGLVGNDSVIFLDEAHCSRAFSQTLSAVRIYRGDSWARTPLGKPFSFVEMTATPTQKTAKPFCLDEMDRRNPVLHRRLTTAKPTTLQLVKARAKDTETLASALAAKAVETANATAAKRIAVMVNRIATARRVFELLSSYVPAANLHLLIGRMRPVDRDKLVEQLSPLKAGTARDSNAAATFVVSTQCLEVGADLDFDVLVTECASIDALLQRFGRLDRLGSLSGNARGCIMNTNGIVESKDPDPIYGGCIAETWLWLNQLAQGSAKVNMGIESGDPLNPSVAEALKALSADDAAKMRRVGAEAPALLPAHLDALVQTSPRPAAEPEVALFLHGRDEGTAEVQVVWRADLNGVPVTEWADTVALCPPVSAEAMSVRLAHFRQWLVGEKTSSLADSDLEGAGQDPDAEEDDVKLLQSALIWRGEDSFVVRYPSEVKPNDTIVLSLNQRGWEQFGHAPEPVKDVAEEAISISRNRTLFRVHKSLWPAPDDLNDLLESEEFDWALWGELIEANREFLELRGVASDNYADFKKAIPYPAPEGQPPPGWLLQRKDHQRQGQDLQVSLSFEEDGGGDETSNTSAATTLSQHTRDVRKAAKVFASEILPDFVSSFEAAAHLHDAGKADERFQAMLHGGDRLAAAFAPDLLAKGEVFTSGFYEAIRKKSGLPHHFRHELVSLHFADSACKGRSDFDLLMHLIASHHGYCRPFAPVVCDPNPPDVLWEDAQVSSADRIARPAHHLASGIARRFWRLNRDFGWWGSAYLEACLRLADWAVSASRGGEESRTK